MIDKNDVLKALLMQCDIAVHLHGKLPEGSLDFRPTPEQRSTLELLRYISFCGIGGARMCVTGSWDGYKEVAERAEDMTADEFPAAMERQKNELRGLFAEITDEAFANQEVTYPTGAKATLGPALLDLPLAWMIGYRMQLFLYAKQAGNKDIGTANNWAGIDWDPSGATDDDA